MTFIPGTSGVTSSSQSTNSLNPIQQLASSNSFLQLLVAQLKYQNPMQPVSNTQFVTQLAQFQMLSDLTAIRSDLNALVAAGKASAGKAAASGGGTTTGASSGTAAGASTGTTVP